MAVSDIFRQHMNTHYNNLFDEMEKICNHTVMSRPPPDDGLYCPPVMDEWGTCFNYTKASDIAYVPCPFYLSPNPTALSFRRCEANGTWQIVANGKPWTNMSACTQNATFPEENFHQAVSYVYLFIAMASLSLVLLTISLAIFYGFRQLRCDRITIHKNLFISYVFTAVTWILYYRLIVLDGAVLLKNPVWCQLLNVLAQAFTASNHSWMFCEGLYLHIIMAHALRTGKKLIKCLVIGGWAAPFILTAIYGAVRWATAQQTHSCWIHEDVLQWIIAAPVTASVIINICILVNLVRLLMTKLQQIPDAPQSKKAAKATLILVPLLGLQFLMFPMRPEPDSQLYPVYLYIMAFLQASQGTMVSIIFCFCNGEVRSIIRRKWHQHRLMSGSVRKNTGITSSTFVDGYSMVDSTRDGTNLKSKVAQENKNSEALEMKGSPVATTPLVNNSVEITVNHADDNMT